MGLNMDGGSRTRVQSVAEAATMLGGWHDGRNIRDRSLRRESSNKEADFSINKQVLLRK